MAENTKIEWAHHTFNPWIGCTKVSPACDHCYAEADFAQRRKVVQWGAGQPRKLTADSTWSQPLRWNAEAERLGVRYRVFCASLADVFDNEVPDEWRTSLYNLIALTPHLDWLLLTKRIGNALDMLPAFWAWGPEPHGWQSEFKNVWIGASITSQAEADRDIQKLLAVPAAKRFLSMEPLLAPVDIVPFLGGRSIQCGCGWRRDENFLVGATPDKERCMVCGQRTKTGPTIDWVIVGGESGPNARPMHTAWARSLLDQCQISGTPFFFKQWGEWLGQGQRGNPLHVPQQLNASNVSVRVGKKAAGRELDGRTWDEVPS